MIHAKKEMDVFVYVGVWLFSILNEAIHLGLLIG